MKRMLAAALPFLLVIPAIALAETRIGHLPFEGLSTHTSGTPDAALEDEYSKERGVRNPQFFVATEEDLIETWRAESARPATLVHRQSPDGLSLYALLGISTNGADPLRHSVLERATLEVGATGARLTLRYEIPDRGDPTLPRMGSCDIRPVFARADLARLPAGNCLVRIFRRERRHERIGPNKDRPAFLDEEGPTRLVSDVTTLERTFEIRLDRGGPQVPTSKEAAR